MFETATVEHRSRLAVRAADVSWRWVVPAVQMAAMVSGNWPLSRDADASGWTCLPRVASRSPGGGEESLRSARAFTAETLRRWGLADRCDDVVVVVSELLTNALRHAVPGPGQSRSRRPVRLALLLQPGPCVLCAVADPSDRAPRLREPGWFDETGRGLHVVASLSDEWGWTLPGPSGKVVWAIFSGRGTMVRR